MPPQLMMMSLETEKTWEELWNEFKLIFKTEDTFLFHKWVEEIKIKPKK